MRLALLFCLLSGPAFAVPQCGTRDEMLAGLKNEYGEHVVVTATANVRGLPPGLPAEFVVNPSSKTWTMLLTNPNTLETCAIMDGKDWSMLLGGA